MPDAIRLIRARPAGVWLAVFLVTLLLRPLAAEGQIPVEEPDSTPPDTLVVPIPPEEVPGDTVPLAVQEAAAPDTLPLTLPDFPDAFSAGWSAGRWEWTREELSKLPGLTALEFLQRIPGIARFRAGGFGRPEAVTAMGMGGSRLRVFIDGLEMEPFTSGGYELETLPLRDIERVRVERSLTELRVDVRTYRHEQVAAHSVVELGTGVYQTRLLRALFSRGLGRRSTATGSFDLVTTRGSGIGEPYSHSSSVFRWTFAPSESWGLQTDWRRTSIDRSGSVYPRQMTRSDLSVRARSRLGDRVVIDALLGRTAQEDGPDHESLINRHSTQLALRGGYAGERSTAELTARLRSRDDLYPLQPPVDLEARLSFQPLPSARIEGTGRLTRWDANTSLGSRLTGTVSPISAVQLFASIEAGSRPVATFATLGDPDAELLPSPVLLSVPSAGWRAGVETSRGAGMVGFAAFSSELSTLVPFGMPFDDHLLPVTGVDVAGAEAYARIPVPVLGDALSLEGWYTRIPDAVERPYTPAEIGRLGFRYHGLYFGDQLEPNLRLEAIHRGNTRVPAAEGGAFEYLTPAYQAFDLTLQVRIIDVEAFLIWNNLLNNQLATDLPGGPAATPRIVYGAEWRFQN